MFVLSLTGCGGDDEGGAASGGPRPTGCTDAAAGPVPADDASWAVVRNLEGDAWLVGPGGESRVVDLDVVADRYQIVAGGDGRLWSVAEGGRVTATDLGTGATSKLTLDAGWDRPAIGASADGAVVADDGRVAWLTGSPIEADEILVEGLEGPTAPVVGPDGLAWVPGAGETPRVTLVSPDGVVQHHEVEELMTGFGSVFAGTDCALVASGGCPDTMTALGARAPAPVWSATVGEGCGGGVAVHGGVAWVPAFGTITRVDLATGVLRAAPIATACGEGLRAFAGDGGVAVTDDCSVTIASLDPIKGSPVDEIDLADRLREPMDAFATGTWPWVGFEDQLIHLPSFALVRAEVEATPGPYGLEVVAVVPPPG